MSGWGSATVAVAPSGDPRIDGVLGAAAWGGAALGYGFPDPGRDDDPYGVYGAGEASDFRAATPAMQGAARALLEAPGAAAGLSVAGFTALDIAETGVSAEIRVARTSADPYGYGTAWTYLPGPTKSAGDLWFSDRLYDYGSPRPGDYAFATLLHELGHALGLEHGHAATAFGPLPAEFDGMEYSVMTYRAAVGADQPGYSNETFGFAQGWMMLDIAALQYLYGADYGSNAGDTRYVWTPDSGITRIDGEAAIAPAANRIFTTIWDGGGHDTFDLSAYETDLCVDLAPGAASVFDPAQLARLAPGERASGNVYTALLYRDDPRSLIEAVLGGGGNDRLAGNRAANDLAGGAGGDVLIGRLGGDDLSGGGGHDRLLGGAGADILTGGRGGDLLRGGAGRDTFRFNKAADSPDLTGKADRIADFEPGRDRIDLSALETAPTAVHIAPNGSDDGVALRVDLDGDGSAEMSIILVGVGVSDAVDILF